MRLIRILFILTGLFFFVTGPSAVAAESLAARVVALSGEVKALASSSGGERILTQGSTLHAGDTLVTAEEGQVQLRFVDGMMLSLYANTRFAIDSYRFSGQESPQDQGHFSLIRGSIHALTGKIGKKFKENYKVKTRMAVLGVRGTDYRLFLEEALHVSVLQGEVSLTNEAGTLLVGPDQQAVVFGMNRLPSLTTQPFPMDRLKPRQGQKGDRKGGGGERQRQDQGPGNGPSGGSPPGGSPSGTAPPPGPPSVGISPLQIGTGLGTDRSGPPPGASPRTMLPPPPP